MTTIIQGGKIIETGYGMLTTKAAQVVPNASAGNLFAVSGPILITGLWFMVSTVFTGTTTTLNVGTAASATSLFSAAVLTSLAVGNWLTAPTVFPNGTSVYNGTSVTVVGPLPAAPGNITWQASAANTGQLQAFLAWVPLAAGAQAS